jgi:hypothetical protein
VSAGRRAVDWREHQRRVRVQGRWANVVSVHVDETSAAAAAGSGLT